MPVALTTIQKFIVKSLQDGVELTAILVPPVPLIKLGNDVVPFNDVLQLEQYGLILRVATSNPTAFLFILTKAGEDWDEEISDPSEPPAPAPVEPSVWQRIFLKYWWAFVAGAIVVALFVSALTR